VFVRLSQNGEKNVVCVGVLLDAACAFMLDPLIYAIEHEALMRLAI